MRVLLAHDYGTRNGGAEVMSLNLRDELRRRGHEAILFTSTAHPLPLPVEADATCFGTTGPLRRVSQALNPHAARRLRALTRRFRPDVVFVKMFLSQLSPLILPVLRDIPSVLSVVNYNLVCPLNTKTLPDGTPCHDAPGRACRGNGCMGWSGVARNAVQRQLTRLEVFDHVFANSRWVADRLRAEGIRIDGWIHNGIPERPARPPLSGPPVIGYAGRLVPKKGVDVLLRAMSGLVRHVPDATLLIAGDGPLRHDLQILTRELRITKHVHFLGHLDNADLENRLAPAWVQAVPSVWEEPFGLVASEAMMRGTAVVVSDAGGLTEQVIEGETGYRVPAGDADALGSALERIVRDRGHAERLGATARHHATRTFTLDRYTDRVVEMLESIRARSTI